MKTLVPRAALAVLLASGQSEAQPARATLAVPIDRQATNAAAAGLSTFRTLVHEQNNFREMGFETPDEVDRATLGDPIAGHMVRLDELGSFKAGADPAKLLHLTRKLVFPVLVGGEVRSSLTVSAGKKGWVANRFGAAGKASSAFRARGRSANATKLGTSEFALVEIPAMRLVFVGYVTGGSLFLAPVIDYPAFGLVADVPVKAEAVFSKLAPATRAHMDAPG